MAVLSSSLALSLFSKIPAHISSSQVDANLSSSHTLSRQTQVFFRRCKSSMRKSAGSSLDVVVRGSPVAGLGTLDPNSEDDEKDGSRDDDASGSGSDSDSSDFKSRMERMMGTADENFRGKDLATLIRNKYGRSYDVQFIRKKSFPLTEEEYIYHLDNIADNLRYWGAVSTVRTSLEKTKEKPRIGKAVSIFIDLDDTGGRAGEWINR